MAVAVSQLEIIRDDIVMESEDLVQVEKFILRTDGENQDLFQNGVGGFFFKVKNQDKFRYWKNIKNQKDQSVEVLRFAFKKVCQLIEDRFLKTDKILKTKDKEINALIVEKVDLSDYCQALKEKIDVRDIKIFSQNLQIDILKRKYEIFLAKVRKERKHNKEMHEQKDDRIATYV